MVDSQKVVKVFYNDTESHVTCNEGLLVEISKEFITIILNADKKVSIPMNKVVRIEEGEKNEV